MEVKLGTAVETLVDLRDTNGFGNEVVIQKGTVGIVCDTDHLNEGIVFVEIWGDRTPKDEWGVYVYRLEDLKILQNQQTESVSQNLDLGFLNLFCFDKTYGKQSWKINA